MTWSQSQIDLQQRFWNFCKDKGMNEKAISGAMGNISQESAWDITLEEVGGGGGYGLIQWTGSRRTQLEAYGIDEIHQFEFFYSELTGQNLSVTGASLQWQNANGYTYDNYKNGSYSVSDSVQAFCWCFERPAVATANIDYRISEGEFFYTQFQGTGNDENGAKVENSVEWMINIANDNSHGYDQDKRWGPDYDCSSFIISAYQQSGVPVKTNGATYTGNMKSVFLATGFTLVDWNNDMAKLVRGDVLLNEVHHTACYIGDGKIVQASINELGTATGGQTGDQTGKEIYIRDYYVYSSGWDCVLRFGNGSIDPTNPTDPSDPNDPNDPHKGEVYAEIEKTSYITSQLSTEQITFLKTLRFNDKVKLKYTFDRRKYNGVNYTGKRLTIDDKSYIIVDVENNGFIKLTTDLNNKCYKFVNPKLLKGVN
jgi:hypothetical protein